MTEIDVQAFMTGEDEVVALVRAALPEQLAFAEEHAPGATDEVLRHVANVSYRGDLALYMQELAPVVQAALLLALQPTFDRLRRETDAHATEAKRLDEEHAKFLCEFEAFRQMRTPKSIQ